MSRTRRDVIVGQEVSTKPKNRVYCPDCQRPKMLFQTEGEAKTFIKFNGDALLGDDTTKTLRVYYCSGCCGYHITSHRKRSDYDGRTDELINRYQADVTHDRVRDIIEGNKLCQELKKLGFTSRKAVNRYLETLDYEGTVKSEARRIYYKEMGI